MLYSEFFERTGVSVDSKEYAAIEEVYYHFSGSKDEFCTWWCKLNADRVKAAKKAREEREEELRRKDLLHEILFRLGKGVKKANGDYSKMPLTVQFLPQKYLSFLQKIGFRFQITYREAIEYGYPAPRHYTVEETSYQIKKYLNIV